jgi:pimeloyl-ACP methyl ester carboxylesterase
VTPGWTKPIGGPSAPAVRNPTRIHAIWWHRAAGWIARASIGLLIVVAVLAAGGLVYEAVATDADMRQFPPPGELVDIGGYRLHIHCTGAGSPTVILESALPAGSSVWAWVQPAVSRTARVCAYDRAGEGWSDLGPRPRDAIRVATELHTLLANAGVEGPFVLVGHSFGGLYTRVFASQYPDQVVGMVLIDVSHPDQWTRTPEGAGVQRANDASAAVAPVLARLGLLRLSGYIQVDPDLPTRQRAELRAFTDGTRVWDSDSAVFQSMDATMAEVRASAPLASMPLVVLTATEHGFSPETERLHQQLQTELAGLSFNSRHRIIDGATHVSLVDNREQSQTTVEAIQEVLAATLDGPLAQQRFAPPLRDETE